jgi:hypothetical protein
MIGSYIQGGLGNQLFQIAAGYAHANRVGAEFSVIEGQHYLPLQGNKTDTYKETILRNVKSKPEQEFGGCVTFKQQGHKYEPIPDADNLFLYGFFQSEKYFQDYKQEIADLYSIPSKVDKLILDRHPYLEYEKVVSLHVRRGDYLNNPNIHPTMSVEYYRDAIDSIPDKDKILVFSDDIEWCKQNLGGKMIYYSTFDKDYLDIYAMSKCYHHIMSNSTFGWWGAWLSNTKGTVIGPKKWFGPDGPQDTEDTLPHRWEKL